MSYPRWVCEDCGKTYGRRPVREATWHLGICGICGERTSVTQPRDFGHLHLAPLFFLCARGEGKDPLRIYLHNVDRQALQALETFDMALTRAGRGPILSITVRGMTFHRTPEGAYLRSEDDGT